jgi:integrase/recombinase XerC
MSPWHKVRTLAERYDLGLHYMRSKDFLPDTPKPSPTCHWPKENIELLERYRDWLLGGGVSESVTNLYHVMMAGHVLGLTLKPHSELDLNVDFECAMEYVRAKKLSEQWIKNCRNSLKQLRRFLRQERGLGEEREVKPFDSAHLASDLPMWLVNELERYQRLLQRNWRDARIEQNIRRFWCVYLKIWRFLNVQSLADLKRVRILDYVDHRLSSGHSTSGVNADLRSIHTFLLFLQDEGYSVPQSLLRIPPLKKPDPLPKYLTDEQVKKLRDEIERNVHEARLASHRRQALLVRAAFYLLWQGGMRLGEVEELRLEDLDWPQKRLSVREGKGRKDRTIYLTETTMMALVDYLAVRGAGSGDHVFLFRNAPLGKDLIRSRLKAIGERIGVKVYPHRLRHTCATQLLNAGCRVTSIQRFLGHKELGTTLIYARVHDQNVADDYFAAMQRVEQNLELDPRPKEKDIEIVNVQKREKLLEFAGQLAQPELCWAERMAIGAQLLMLFGVFQEHSPPETFVNHTANKVQ